MAVIKVVDFDADSELADKDDAPGFGSLRTDALSDAILEAATGTTPDLSEPDDDES